MERDAFKIREEGRILGASVLIFVTVGTHTEGFDRLIKEVDGLKGRGKIKEDVIMQIGNTKYEPKNCKWFRFESFKKILELNEDASVVIAHAGAGCIVTALGFAKPLVVVPRYKKFGEHVDDHQLDIAGALEKEKIAVPVYDIADLLTALKKAAKPNTGEEKSRLILNLKAYLNARRS